MCGTVCLKGFEDSQIDCEDGHLVRPPSVSLAAIAGWTECVPLRRTRDSVFENLVERASRERTNSGISLKRSHKMGHSAFARELEVVASTSFSSDGAGSLPSTRR